MKTNGRKVDPQRYTALAFSICSIGWYILVMELYDRFLSYHTTHINTIIIIIVALLSGGVINEIYSRNDRYIKVYNKYVSAVTIKNKGKFILFSWLFILLPYLLFVLFWF
jgi:hypothetical protein